MEKNEALQKAIEKAVGDTLPKVQGELLQKRLAQADEMEESIIAKDKHIEKVNDELTEALKKVKSLANQMEEARHMKSKAADHHNENVAKSLELESEKRNHTMALLKLELELTKAGKEELMSLNRIVFQNRTIRETVTSLGMHIPQPGTYIDIQDQYGCNHKQWIATGPPEENGDKDNTTTEG